MSSDVISLALFQFSLLFYAILFIVAIISGVAVVLHVLLKLFGVNRPWTIAKIALLLIVWLLIDPFLCVMAVALHALIYYIKSSWTIGNFALLMVTWLLFDPNMNYTVSYPMSPIILLASCCVIIAVDAQHSTEFTP